MDHEIKEQTPIIIQPDDMTIKVKDIVIPAPETRNEEKEENDNG